MSWKETGTRKTYQTASWRDLNSHYGGAILAAAAITITIPTLHHPCLSQLHQQSRLSPYPKVLPLCARSTFRGGRGCLLLWGEGMALVAAQVGVAYALMAADSDGWADPYERSFAALHLPLQYGIWAAVLLHCTASVCLLLCDDLFAQPVSSFTGHGVRQCVHTWSRAPLLRSIHVVMATTAAALLDRWTGNSPILLLLLLIAPIESVVVTIALRVTLPRHRLVGIVPWSSAVCWHTTRVDGCGKSHARSRPVLDGCRRRRGGDVEAHLTCNRIQAHDIYDS